MRFRGPQTLKRRIDLLLVIALGPAFLLVVANAFGARRVERREVQQQAYRLVSAAVTAQEQLLASTDRLFVAFPRISRLAPDRQIGCEEFGAAVGALGAFQNAGVVALDGRIICAVLPTSPAVDVSASGWFQTARTTPHLSVGTLEQGTITQGPTVVLARRMPAGVDDVILFAALDLVRLSEFLQTISLPVDSSMTAIDRAGTIVARHPEHERWVGKPASGAVLADTLDRRDGVTESVGIDGVRRLYGFRRVAFAERTPLLLTTGIPTRVAYADADRRLYVNLAILGVVALGAYLFAHRVSTELFRKKLDSVLRAARLLSAGELSARTGAEWTPDEVGELARTFDAMAWTLQERNRDLERTVASLRALTAKLETIREDERTHISREIHDELGQALTGIRMDMDRIDEQLARASMPADLALALRAKVSAARRLIDTASATARRVSRQLRPSVLDVLGFGAAVEWQLEEFRTRTGIDAELVADEPVPDVPEPTSVALFRILQETLTNVMRHAAATAVTIRLSHEDQSVVLEIMDNGRGFDASVLPSPRQSLGLLGMRERAAAFGGTLTVTSAPGQGTTIHVSIPLAASDAAYTPS